MSTKKFEVAKDEALQIPSSWRVKKEVKAGGQQTEKCIPNHIDSQTDVSAFSKTGCANVEVQCDRNTDTSTVMAKPHHEGSTVYIYPGTEPNEEALLRFLKKVEGPAISILEANVKSHAFDGYEASWDRDRATVQHSHCLSPPFVFENEFHVSQLEWNCNGTSFAVAYSRLDTPSWCLDRGSLCIWSAATLFTANKPDITLEQDSYVTSLAFHPQEPATLAVGTHTGDILILSVGRQETAELFNSKNSSPEITHRDPVIKVCWIEHRDQRGVKGYWLCSVSGDGKILIWSKTNQFASPWLGYQATAKGTPVGVTTADAIFEKRTIAGVTSTLLVLGTENGEALLTRTNAIPYQQPQNPLVKDSQALPSLEVDALKAHFSAVQGVAFSPFGREVFATVGSDGWLKLYSTLERAQMIAVEPTSGTEAYLTHVAFSRSRPAVAAVVSRNSFLYIFDFLVSKSKPVASFQAPGSEGFPMTQVCFHPTEKSVLLTGDARGNVNVWILPNDLSEPSVVEKSLFSQTKNTQLTGMWYERLGIA